MKMRILLSLSVALVALVALPSTARADTISVSGVGQLGLFGPISITGSGSALGFAWTQSSPIPANIAYGTYQFDPFSFSVNSLEPAGVASFPILTLSGSILADNGVCLNGSISASCVGLYLIVTASDPGQITGALNVSVNQTFAVTSGAGTITTVPVSESLSGSCNTGNSGGSVNSTSTFSSPTTPALPTLSAVCTGTNAFNVTNPNPIFSTVLGGTPLDIGTQASFGLDGGSISLPTGSCAGSSTCVAPDLPPTTTPEPSSLALLGSGMLGLLGFAKRLMWSAPRG